MVAPEFLDRFLDLLAGLLVETGNANVSHSATQQEGALYAGRLQLFRRQDEMQKARNPGPAYFKLRLPLPRFGQQLGDLIDLQAADNVAVDGDNFIAGSESGLLRRRTRRGLENDHAARQQRYN